MNTLVFTTPFILLCNCQNSFRDLLLLTLFQNSVHFSLLTFFSIVLKHSDFMSMSSFNCMMWSGVAVLPFLAICHFLWAWLLYLNIPPRRLFPFPPPTIVISALVPHPILILLHIIILCVWLNFCLLSNSFFHSSILQGLWSMVPQDTPPVNSSKSRGYQC